MSAVTPTTRGSSRNAHGSGWVGGAWGNKYGWCEEAPDGNAWTRTHYHCEACGVCLDDWFPSGDRHRGQRSDTRYCSNACRQRAYRERATVDAELNEKYGVQP